MKIINAKEEIKAGKTTRMKPRNTSQKFSNTNLFADMTKIHNPESTLPPLVRTVIDSSRDDKGLKTFRGTDKFDRTSFISVARKEADTTLRMPTKSTTMRMKSITISNKPKPVETYKHNELGNILGGQKQETRIYFEEFIELLENNPEYAEEFCYCIREKPEFYKFFIVPFNEIKSDNKGKKDDVEFLTISKRV